MLMLLIELGFTDQRILKKTRRFTRCLLYIIFCRSTICL